MTYLVMETHTSYAVVLDETGVFLKVANFGYEVGQITDYVVPMDVPEKICEDEFVPVKTKTPEKKKKKGLMLSLTALAACCLLMVTTMLGSDNQVYASVFMTINPQVRIDVNKEDKVVGLDGINEDGDLLIEGYEYKKKDLRVTMDELVDRAIEMGYLHEGGKIVIDLSSGDEEWIRSTGTSIRKHMDEHFGSQNTVTTEIHVHSYGDSDYDDTSDYYGESDYDDASDYAQESNYEDYSNYDTHSDYGEDSDYDEGSDYDEDIDYDDSDYHEPVEESEYSADSVYDEESVYHEVSDYEENYIYDMESESESAYSDYDTSLYYDSGENSDYD